MSASLNELQEMFPDHKLSTIQRALEDMKGNVENAVIVLLDTPADKNSPSTSLPKANKEHSSHKSSHHKSSAYPGSIQTGPPQNPSQIQRPKVQSMRFEHIFPSDFLRWPDYTEVIKVNVDGTPIKYSTPPPEQIRNKGVSGFPSGPSGRAPSGYAGVGYTPSMTQPSTAVQGGYGIGIPACDPNDDLPIGEDVSDQIDINSELIPGVSVSSSKEKNTSKWWDNFKKRFQSKSHYNQL